MLSTVTENCVIEKCAEEVLFGSVIHMNLAEIWSVSITLKRFDPRKTH